MRAKVWVVQGSHDGTYCAAFLTRQEAEEEADLDRKRGCKRVKVWPYVPAESDEKSADREVKRG